MAADYSAARVNKDKAGALISAGSTNVYLDNFPSATEGSTLKNGDVITSSQTNVYVNNKRMAMEGARTARGQAVGHASQDVFVGNADVHADVIIVQNDELESADPKTHGTAITFLKQQVAKGHLDPGIVQRTESAQSTAVDNKPGSTLQGAIQNCGQIHSMSTFPLDLRVSKYFTLDNLLRKWTDGQLIQFNGHRPTANKGWRIDEIVCNLSLLAQNVLDPLRDQYPDFRVTNTFREGAGQAQHGNGQAADVIFADRARPLTYQRAQWMRDNLPYDQILIEYRDAVANGKPYIQNWVHISFVGQGIYRLSGTGGPTGNRPASAGDHVGSLYNDVWKGPGLQLY